MNGRAPQIRCGSPADTTAILSLLASAGLPTEDLPSIPQLRTWVLESGGTLCGVIALEPFGSEGLLRSLAVDSDYRHRGVARTLVARLERDAHADGVRKLVLLTQTAEAFFRSLGYENIDRRHVSDEMQRCAEFRSLCPASAACMSKSLAPR